MEGINVDTINEKLSGDICKKIINYLWKEISSIKTTNSSVNEKKEENVKNTSKKEVYDLNNPKIITIRDAFRELKIKFDDRMEEEDKEYNNNDFAELLGNFYGKKGTYHSISYSKVRQLWNSNNIKNIPDFRGEILLCLAYCFENLSLEFSIKEQEITGEEGIQKEFLLIAEFNKTEITIWSSNNLSNKLPELSNTSEEYFTLYYWKINQDADVEHKHLHLHCRVGLANLKFSGESKKWKKGITKNVEGFYYYSNETCIAVKGTAELLSDKNLTIQLKSDEDEKIIKTQINLAKPKHSWNDAKLIKGTYSTFGRNKDFASAGKVILEKQQSPFNQNEVLKKYKNSKHDKVESLDNWVDSKIYYYLHNQRWEVHDNYNGVDYGEELVHINEIAGFYHGYYLDTYSNSISIYTIHLLDNGKVIRTEHENTTIVGFIRYAKKEGVLIDFDFKQNENYYRYQMSIKFNVNKHGIALGVYSGLNNDGGFPMSGRVGWRFIGKKNEEISKNDDFKSGKNIELILKYLEGKLSKSDLNDFGRYTDINASSIYFLGQ
jgi:hypothetical protein